MTQNILAELPPDTGAEIFQRLAGSRHVLIERIISRAQCSAPGEWYEQARAEFVLLVSGSATLVFEGGEPLQLSPGDYLDIPAGRRHRVERTDPLRETIWLAVHYD